MTSSRFIQEIAIDHYTGNEITYPRDDGAGRFDVLFRKAGAKKWRYLFSHEKQTRLVKLHLRAIIEAGGEYRLVATKFGYVVKEQIQ